MQYSSRICVLVEKIDDWNKLEKINFKKYGLFYSVSDFKKFGEKFFVDMEWSVNEKELDELVTKIQKALDYKCIIIADTRNINIDPYLYCIYFFGRLTNTFYIPEAHWKKVEKIGRMNIKRVDEWINLIKKGLAKKEIEYLKKYGLEYDEKSKKCIDKLEEERRKKEEERELKEEQERMAREEVYLKRESDTERLYLDLVGTQYENRNDRIEKLKINDKVKLVRDPENQYDSNAILVVNEEGSLGHVIGGISRELSPLIDKKILKIKDASVHEVKPLSEFVGTRKKGGEVCIAVEYELTENAKEIILEEIKNDLDYDNWKLSGIYEKIMRKLGILDDNLIKIIEKMSFKKTDDGTGWLIDEVNDLNCIPEKIFDIPVIAIDAERIIWNISQNTKLIKSLKHIVKIPDGIKRIYNFPTRMVENIKKICIPKSVNEITFSNYYEESIAYYYFMIEIDDNPYAEKCFKSLKYNNGLNIFCVLEKGEKESEVYDIIKKFSFKFDEKERMVAILKSSGKSAVPERFGNEEVKALMIEPYVKKIKELFISKNIENIKLGCFENIEKLIISEENKNYSTDGYGLYNKDKTILYRYVGVGIKDYTVLDTVKIIKEYAFDENKELINLILPTSIITIEEDAFHYSSIKKIIGIDLEKFGLNRFN